MSRPPAEIELDLPFLVNGTLSAEQRAEIEALMAEDAVLSAEHDALLAIRAGMQAEEVSSPGEFGLARLLRDVAKEGAAAPVRSPSRIWSRPELWQAVAAVAVVGLLSQTFFLRDSGVPEQDRYVLASALTPGALVVGFAPDATEAGIRTLLLDAELEIVAGPSALGLYRLDVIDGADLTAATEVLRAAADIVESVENAEN